jgi:hypothetical protein
MPDTGAARRDQERIARAIREFAWVDPHLNPLPSLSCPCCSHGLPDHKKLFEAVWRAAVDDDAAVVPTPTVSQCTSEKPCGATLRLQCQHWAECSRMEMAPPLAAARDAANRRCARLSWCGQLFTAVCTAKLPCGLMTTKLDIDHCRPGFAALRRDGANVVYSRRRHADEGRVYYDAQKLMLERFELPDIRANWLLRMVPPRGPVSPMEFMLLVTVMLYIIAKSMYEMQTGLMYPRTVVILFSLLVPLTFVLTFLPAEIDRRWQRYIKCG